MYYTAYNLAINSQLKLPELQPLSAYPPIREPDVHIRLGAIDRAELADDKQLGPFLWVDESHLWLNVPQICWFYVHDGKEIVIDPEPGIDEDSIRLFLLGSAFGALLFQRRHLVLHGNAIRIGDHCMVCIGNSGMGKSTLAAGFMQRGFPILADDVVAVDSACRALPGVPRIKLWHDTTKHLGMDRKALAKVRPNIEKYNIPLSNTIDESPVPIRWIYVLDTDHIDQVRIEPISGMQRYQPLHLHTYRIRFLHGMALKSEHLQLCSKLAGAVHLANAVRPKAGFLLDAMIDSILRDIEEHP